MRRQLTADVTLKSDCERLEGRLEAGPDGRRMICDKLLALLARELH